jgi:hypothetical protein
MRQSTSKKHIQFGEPQSVVDHLHDVISAFLQKRPHLSINGISKKCRVSEPTLRRIMSKRVKTAPQLTTLLDLLTFISQTTSVREIVNKYPGPIADFILEQMPSLHEVDQDFSNDLNEELRDPVKFLIYQLSLHAAGVSEDQVGRLYGNHGLQLMHELVEKAFLVPDQNVFRARAKTFNHSPQDFVRHFKTMAEFIKPDKYQSRKPLNPSFSTLSESLTPEAYEKVRRLQSQLERKVQKNH